MEEAQAQAQPQEEEHQKLVDTFLGITSSTREEALFFLESHNWEIDPAVLSFFDSATGAAASSPPPSSPLPAPAVAAAGATAMASSSSTRDKKAKRPAGGIHTLSDLNRGPHGDGSDSDSDGPPEYYTGGEKSGMLVQDPSKGGGDDHVDAIFDQARQLGAMEGPLDHSRLSSSSRSFTGTGRLLSGETLPAAPQPPQAVIHNIVFWRNGFSVNDSPLRRLDDPENASFLESIKKSECPKELEPADRRSPVHVNLIRKDENYVEPEKQYSPFQGVGRTLGGGSNATSSASIPASAPAPSAGLVVDDSKPSTSIQLRLSDGTRMVARFNLDHTLGDIRAFIDASRPGGYPPYRLQSVGFPPKQLTDLNQTIQEAGLANSVVIQKH